MRLKTHLYRLVFLLFLSYGFLYFSYKWLDPTQVNTDFIRYYEMVQHPLNFHVAPSPWVYRQLTAIIANGVWRLHIYYPDSIQFHNPHYDQHIFFAVLFTNYVSVVVAAWLSTIMVDRYLQSLGRSSSILPLLGGMLCFFSFYLQVTTITGQADGLSWALVALCYLLYEKRSALLFCAVLLLSILQREILPLIFFSFAVVSLVTDRSATRQHRQFLSIAAIWSLIVFAVYMLLRQLIHAPGNEYQAEPHALLHELLVFRPTKAYIMQVCVGQNLLLLMAALWFFRFKRYREYSPNILTLPATCCALLLISIVTNISNNASRMLAMLTPIVAVEIAVALIRLDRDRAFASDAHGFSLCEAEQR